MLEKLPSFVGEALKGIRPGLGKIMSAKNFAEIPATIADESTAFADGAPMPADFSADGRKVSPPLTWRNLPKATAEVLLVIEDADSPTPEPLVRAIATGLPERDGGLAEGALKSAGSPGEGHALGRASFMTADDLPLDPPTGHGPHRDAIQVFALDRTVACVAAPGRVPAEAVLVGIDERT